MTIKIRTGWDAGCRNAIEVVRVAAEAGVKWVAIHGRTRAQGYSGDADWDFIGGIKAKSPIPIIGNGDVRTIHDAAFMLQSTGCTGIAIGRGALLNPWLFAQLARWEQTGEPGPPATWHERLAFMERHFHRLVANRGEHFGCLTFRKVAAWYCRVLRAGKEVQQRIIRLDSVALFEELVGRMRERGPVRGWEEWVVAESPIRTPKGPIERW